MEKEKGNANKILDTIANRMASKIATLEKEVAILYVKNEELKEENEALKKKEVK